MNIPGERFAKDAEGVIDMPSIKKGDRIWIVIHCVEEATRGFRGKIVGTNNASAS